jgi:hypothetical protein
VAKQEVCAEEAGVQVAANSVHGLRCKRWAVQHAQTPVMQQSLWWQYLQQHAVEKHGQ